VVLAGTVDSPAGVGFSYSNTSSDYTTDNTKTAHDDWVFMQRWVERFPEFADNKLWITGESYGGDYGVLSHPAVLELSLPTSSRVACVARWLHVL